MKSSSFPFLVINEAAKEETNQCHQGYATWHSSTNDSSSSNRRGGFTCNNQNGQVYGIECSLVTV